MTPHRATMIDQLASLEEVDGWLWASKAMGRAMCEREKSLLEARVADLGGRGAEDARRAIVTRLRAATGVR